MVDSINPERLTPVASLNRVRIVELPGVAVESDVLGRTGYELLSARALADIVRQHADPLRIAEERDTETAALLPRFGLCFEDGDSAVRAAAEAVARQFGRRLGYLILTLRRGDAANRRARPDWDDRYWAHWATITTIRVAGGLVSGSLGPPLVEHAAHTVADAGMTDCSVRLASWPALLPLIGAARTPGSEDQATLVFDFGHSFVKRGYALCDGGTVSELRLLPSLPSSGTASLGDTNSAQAQARRLDESMASVMADSWRRCRALGQVLAPTMVVSIANYVRDGQPLPRQGSMYATLAALSDNLARWLSERVSNQVGWPVDVVLLHDGTAAARTYAGEANAAVVMLGTALGVGFPPPADLLRPISPGFAVHSPPLPPA